MNTGVDANRLEHRVACKHGQAAVVLCPHNLQTQTGSTQLPQGTSRATLTATGFVAISWWLLYLLEGLPHSLVFPYIRIYF